MTSNTDYETHDDRGRQSDLAVMEVSEYKQKRRLERILDAHDDVEDTYDAAMYGAYVANDVQPEAVPVLLLRSVQQFIRELLHPLKEHAREADGRDRYWFGDPEKPLGGIHFEHRDDVVFVGLRDVLNADYTYETQWTEQVKPRNMPVTTETHREVHAVPEAVSWKAYERLKEFAAQERGLDLAYDESDEMNGDSMAPDY